MAQGTTNNHIKVLLSFLYGWKLITCTIYMIMVIKGTCPPKQQTDTEIRQRNQFNDITRLVVQVMKELCLSSSYERDPLQMIMYIFLHFWLLNESVYVKICLNYIA